MVSLIMLFFHNVPVLKLMPILTTLNDSISAWIADFGYIGVFATTLIETIFPPIPSEIVYLAIGFMAYVDHRVSIKKTD